jgi:hypothetical protein
VGNGISLSAYLDRTMLVFSLVAKESEKRDDPEIARFSCGRGIGSESIDLALEDAPVILRVGPCTDNFILHFRGGIETEVQGTLTVDVLQSVKNVWREDGAFYANAWEVHCAPSGRRM